MRRIDPRTIMVPILRFLLLLAIKGLTLVFYRFDARWLNPRPSSWGDLKVIALLHHTSLYEWLYAGASPTSILWRISHRAFVPIADKTAARPVVGAFLKSLVAFHEPISREPDQTWQAVLDRLSDDVMIVILPEGRMMRANGLDKHGRPMTVRGGIADILRAVRGGQMLLVYLGGLHHVHAPGERRAPRLWKTLRIAFETVPIEDYKDSLAVTETAAEFKATVRDDLERRRDLHCPVDGNPPRGELAALEN